SWWPHPLPPRRPGTEPAGHRARQQRAHRRIAPVVPGPPTTGNPLTEQDQVRCSTAPRGRRRSARRGPGCWGRGPAPGRAARVWQSAHMADAPRAPLPTSFRRFWAGEAVSDLGSWITLLALQALVVTDLHAGATGTGLLSAARWLLY